MRMLGRSGRDVWWTHECWLGGQYGSRHGCGCGWPRTARVNRKREKRAWRREWVW